ncbi:glycosyl hydrolases family 18 domain-containing protein [Sarocladium implicatum]|nr:glycosyl hydrolases family 18 domain-containing protein [Sarocladium implicatum]
MALSLPMAARGSHPHCGQPMRRIMYLTGQHNVVPEMSLAKNITHVILAFMTSDVFNVDESPDSWSLFTTVNETRPLFDPEAKVMVAIGGWGDSVGFEEAARDKQSRQRWARQVRAMVDDTGADGIDIDWEYPGGNRDDYKQIPNSERVWEIEAYVALLQELRAALGTDKLLTIAVPGCERDLMAFTEETVPRIVETVDFINVMTYDMMNRRGTVVKHHSGVADSQESLGLYATRGAPMHQLNFGLGYYVKWYMVEPGCELDDDKDASGLGCPTQLLEDPETGADLGRTGSFSWHDPIPEDLASSFARARAAEGVRFPDGSFGYLDRVENRWWSYDTPAVVWDKVELFLSQPRNGRPGGVFAWGLGEDAPEFLRLKATMEAVDKWERREKDEL